jgi:hypothetical protein
MAPNAPIGAARTMIPITPKNIWAIASMACATCSPSFPILEMAKPLRIDTNKTCSRSPPANAPTNVLGMMFIRWVVTPSCAARET